MTGKATKACWPSQNFYDILYCPQNLLQVLLRFVVMNTTGDDLILLGLSVSSIASLPSVIRQFLVQSQASSSVAKIKF
jgi:hypothetical protein